jgi:hypothetical protein
MGLDKLYGFIKTFGIIMKDPNIKILVCNIQQCLENLNNQLIDLAFYVMTINFFRTRPAN